MRNSLTVQKHNSRQLTAAGYLNLKCTKWPEVVTSQVGRKLAAGRKPPRPKAADVDNGAPRSGHPARNLWAQLLARLYGVFALKCSGCGGRVRLIGFITELATVRQILAQAG